MGRARRKASLSMRIVERFHSEIVVFVVLPISLVIWLFRQAKKRCRGPQDPEAHGARVARVSRVVRDHARDPKRRAQKMRTDRSVFDSHSVRNADKSNSRQVRIRDLCAILNQHIPFGCDVGLTWDDNVTLLGSTSDER